MSLGAPEQTTKGLLSLEFRRTEKFQAMKEIQNGVKVATNARQINSKTHLKVHESSMMDQAVQVKWKVCLEKYWVEVKYPILIQRRYSVDCTTT